MREWLSSCLIVEHATDLTQHGSVERLRRNLVSQPLHIRGGNLVDPSELDEELGARTSKILHVMRLDLSDAKNHHLPLASNFLEGCLSLPDLYL